MPENLGTRLALEAQRQIFIKFEETSLLNLEAVCTEAKHVILCLLLFTFCFIH